MQPDRVVPQYIGLSVKLPAPEGITGSVDQNVVYLIGNTCGAEVEISVATSRLERLLSSERELVRRFGAPGAQRVQVRLAQLDAAETLADMRSLPGRGHELSGDRDGALAVDLENPRRLVFEPTEQPPPTKEDGGLDWARVRAITITDIVDYHR